MARRFNVAVAATANVTNRLLARGAANTELERLIGMGLVGRREGPAAPPPRDGPRAA